MYTKENKTKNNKTHNQHEWRPYKHRKTQKRILKPSESKTDMKMVNYPPRQQTGVREAKNRLKSNHKHINKTATSAKSDFFSFFVFSFFSEKGCLHHTIVAAFYPPPYPIFALTLWKSARYNTFDPFKTNISKCLFLFLTIWFSTNYEL